jgi:predicted nucleotidyltransferase
VDRAEIIDALTRFFGSREDVAAAWIFGSVARGTATSRSDVDVAILTSGPRARGLDALHAEMQDEIEALVGRPVQVIDARSAPPDLVHRVMRDGVLVCRRDEPARIAFEVQARNEYWDLLPYLEEYRKPRPA